MTRPPQAVKIHAADNVAVAVGALAAGSGVVVEGECVVLREDIPAGHKISLRTLEPGEPVVKYGFPIGEVTAPIAPGAWVHTHNLKTRLEGLVEYRYEPSERTLKLERETRTIHAVCLERTVRLADWPSEAANFCNL